MDEAGTARLNEMKNTLFGNQNIVLHTADFTRKLPRLLEKGGASWELSPPGLGSVFHR